MEDESQVVRGWDESNFDITCGSTKDQQVSYKKIVSLNPDKVLPNLKIKIGLLMLP